MPAGYEVRQLRKGANVHVCLSCGAVVFDTMAHTSWHAQIERRHDVVCEVLADVTDRVS